MPTTTITLEREYIKKNSVRYKPTDKKGKEVITVVYIVKSYFTSHYNGKYPEKLRLELKDV